MAYNVFKRPMFKRGGSTTGTGIMSHVEPRVKAANGFPTFGLRQQPSQQEVDAFRQAEAQRIQNIRNQPSIFSQILGPRFTDPNYQSPFQNFFSTNTGFGSLSLGIPDRGAGITANIQPVTGTGSGDTGMPVDTGSFETEYENMEANKAAIAAAEKAALEKEKGTGNIDTGAKDDSTYKISDIESEVTKESELLRRLLKDDNYSKGELALIIAGAVKEPGGIAEKLDKARELALPIARKRRQEDKAITLAAYKAAKEKEKYQTRYGQDTDYIRNLKSQAKSLVGRKGYEGKTEDQIFQDLIASKTGESQGREEILTKGRDQIYDLRSKIIRKTQELNKPGANERTKKALEQEIARHKSDLKFFTNLPEFERFYGKDFMKELGLKYGGRVMKAVGGEVSDKDTDMETSDNTVGMAVDKIGEGSGSQTVTEGVQRLSYQELRDRLPQEITNDVVNLLANSEEALQQFAYIRTQDDVNSFNAKYGVNLVIPPTRG